MSPKTAGKRSFWGKGSLPSSDSQMEFSRKASEFSNNYLNQTQDPE